MIKFNGVNLEYIKADITALDVDAIVNSANYLLQGGGGVDGAIHRAAGPELRRESAALGGCETGEAKITKGYRLLAKYVIHTVGPVFGREGGQESALLANCYRNSLRLVDENRLKSIAFPCISTGVFGYPKDQAAYIAIASVKRYFEDKQDTSIRKVIFVTYSDEEFDIYEKYFMHFERLFSTIKSQNKKYDHTSR